MPLLLNIEMRYIDELSDGTDCPCNVHISIDSCKYILLQLESLEKGEGLVSVQFAALDLRANGIYYLEPLSTRKHVCIVHSNGQAYAHRTWNYIPLYYLYRGYTFCLCANHVTD